MNHSRRTFLKGTLAGGVLAVAAGAGLLIPRVVLAAWPKPAFGAKSVGDALSALLGSASVTATEEITIKAPDIAENGAVVPVTISTNIPNAESISILIEKNASPLAFNASLTDKVDGFVVMRVKMAKTSNVTAVVKAGGKLYSSSRNVKVTLGGCGG